jgi:peptidoglycan/LPS O-acetylase OafA/YrhL
MVFVHHTRELIFHNPIFLVVASSMEAGLQVFFVLSAFLITDLLLRERERFGTIHIQAFFLRRALRIWPLYFAFITAAYLFYRVTSPGMLTTRGVLCLFLLTGNMYVYTHGFWLGAVGPLWSISIEEQFYLLWPVLGKLWGRRGYVVLSAVILAVSLVAFHHMAVVHAERYMVWTNSFIEFPFFALGALLALALQARPTVPPAAGRAVLFLAGLFCFLYAIYRFHVRVNAPPGIKTLSGEFGIVGLGCALFLLSAYRMNVPRRLNFWLYLGRISYGLYVFHVMAIELVMHTANRANVHRVGLSWRVIHILEALLSLLVTIGLAAASYYFFERRFLKLKSRFEFVKTRV